ncbi:calcium-binding protein PBP1-like [Wolffia australiana]
MSKEGAAVFEDHLPIMAERLGGEGLIEEMCAGFWVLADAEKGVITLESLKKNAGEMGLGGLSDGELEAMLREGDIDRDGAFNMMEFCVLMFRLSPELMEESRRVVGEAVRLDFLDRKGFA